MTKRDFLKLTDLSRDEAYAVFDLATRLKAAPKGSHTHVLAGRAVAVILEKPSLRTRGSYNVGIAQLGGYPLSIGDEMQLGAREPIRDGARVLARYCDAIVYRTFGTDRLLEMATAPVPVVNALTDDGQPGQILCDMFTIIEAFQAMEGPNTPTLAGRRVAFIGNGTSNTVRSLMEAARLFDFHLTVASPEGYRPPADEIAVTGEHVIFRSSLTAVRDADVIYTDVWRDMGREMDPAVMRATFSDWTVDNELVSVAPPHAIVLHCLPAHRGEEISDEVIEGPRSRVWDQAENRLHVQKALLCFLLGVGDRVP
ncbi:MAG: ornithine carbamoyltransferase [Chloroflexota bacterium]|nr:ornithine carbamoyltransferase [Chloroflexota bacterium]MDQ6905360.1 ornithine carbamoyltransferase [Chloroflexota bacterium]